MTQDTNFISLSDVFDGVYRARKYWLCGVVVAWIIGFIFICLCVAQTRADMVIAPASQLPSAQATATNDVPVIQFLARRLGAGVVSADFVRFENIYNGVQVARVLLDDPRIVAGINAEKRFVFSGAQNIESAEALAHYLQRKVHLDPVKASNLRRLSYWHPDPAFAIYLLEKIHEATDTLIRQSALAEAEARSEYLQETIAGTFNPDHKKSLTYLLLEQERLLMLTRVPYPFAAIVAEPAAAAYKAQWPDYFLVYGVFGMIGAVVGVVIYGVRRARP